MGALAGTSVPSEEKSRGGSRDRRVDASVKVGAVTEGEASTGAATR